MKKLLFTSLLCFALASCAVYQPDFEQGNVVTPQMVKQLHKGMTTTQVKRIMGNPVLMNTFNDNRLNYIYTFKPGKGKLTQHGVSLTFYRGKLSTIEQK